MRSVAYRTAARLLIIPMLLMFIPAAVGIVFDRVLHRLSALAQRWHWIADRAAEQQENKQ